MSRRTAKGPIPVTRSIPIKVRFNAAPAGGRARLLDPLARALINLTFIGMEPPPGFRLLRRRSTSPFAPPHPPPGSSATCHTRHVASVPFDSPSAAPYRKEGPNTLDLLFWSHLGGSNPGPLLYACVGSPCDPTSETRRRPPPCGESAPRSPRRSAGRAYESIATTKNDRWRGRF